MLFFIPTSFMVSPKQTEIQRLFAGIFFIFMTSPALGEPSGLASPNVDTPAKEALQPATNQAHREDTGEQELTPHLSEDTPSNGGTSWSYGLSIGLIPLASGVLPGLGQWLHGEYVDGALYSSTAIIAYRYHTFHGQILAQRQESQGVDSQDLTYRRYLLGRLIQQGVGGLSLYDSFRTAVLEHQQNGDFAFYKKPDRVQDILQAPFAFHHLRRLSTALPLGIGAGLHLIALRQAARHEDTHRKRVLDGQDLFFTGAISYNAGTHEEAVFRGWMLPVLYESFDHHWTANVLQALLFGIAHRGTVSFPLFQTLAGYYLGSLTIEDAFSLEQAVFLHTWWDVFAIASSYASRVPSGNFEGMTPFVLTPLHLVF